MVMPNGEKKWWLPGEWQPGLMPWAPEPPEPKYPTTPWTPWMPGERELPPKYPEPTSTMPPEGIPPGWEFPGYEPTPEDEFGLWYGGPEWGKAEAERENQRQALIRLLKEYGRKQGLAPEEVEARTFGLSVEELEERIRRNEEELGVVEKEGKKYYEAKPPETPTWTPLAGEAGLAPGELGEAWEKLRAERGRTQQAQVRQTALARLTRREYPEWWDRYLKEGYTPIEGDPRPPEMFFAHWLSQQPEFEKERLARETERYREYPQLYPLYMRYKEGAAGVPMTFEEWIEATPEAKAFAEEKAETEWERARRGEMVAKGRWEIPRQW